MKKTLGVIFILLFYQACKETPDNKLSNIKNPYKGQIQMTVNHLHYTEDFADQVWRKRDAFVKNNITVDPLGNQTADLIDLSIDSLESKVYQVIPNLENGVYAFSIYLKGLKGNHGTYSIGALFEPEKKAERQFRSRTIDVGDREWERVHVVINKIGEGNVIVYPGYSRIKGTQLRKIYAWGAQLEKLDSIDQEIKPYSGIDVIRPLSK